MINNGKGDLIKRLKAMGIRKSINSKGALVSLEHLKYEEIINLYFSNKEGGNRDEPKEE